MLLDKDTVLEKDKGLTIDQAKTFIIFARQQKIESFKFADLSVNFSEAAFVESPPAATDTEPQLSEEEQILTVLLHSAE